MPGPEGGSLILSVRERWLQDEPAQLVLRGRAGKAKQFNLSSSA